MKVYLVGMGMGNPALLTAEAEHAIRHSDLMIGARRLLDLFNDLPKTPKFPLVMAKEIAQAIADAESEGETEQVAVLLSGDTGFYSGAARLYPLLKDYEVETLPGISSLSYFCAKCQTTWHDAYVVSCHGRDGGIVGAVQSHAKTFVLTGGEFLVQTLCQKLCDAGLGDLHVWAGEWLSYPQERLVFGTAAALSEDVFDDLAVMLVENPMPVKPTYQAPGLPDSAFIRGDVPMTKEEVRTLAVSKLRLQERDVVWDVGAGTGSVSIECALAMPCGSVYAIERKAEACDLIEANRDQFQLCNLHLVEGNAPDVLFELEAPNAVFIGGSGGNLVDIISAALEKNETVRIVIAAITLETLSEALQAIRLYGFQKTELIQVSVSRSHSISHYHMMKGENPIYLISMESPV